MLDNPLPRVTAVRHVREHVLWLRFNDGLEGEVDLTYGLRGRLFEPLRDPAAFAQVHIEYGTLAWPNGADWAAAPLHMRIRAAKSTEVRPTDDQRPHRSPRHRNLTEISQFYGIVVRMSANADQSPHFHAHYGEFEATVTIRDGMVAGNFPRRALRLVLEWSDLHTDELLANWHLLRTGSPPHAIAPLP